ncbi:glycosyltransferase [bacterium]|nr:glycosyltransferase [bacterium]
MQLSNPNREGPKPSNPKVRFSVITTVYHDLDGLKATGNSVLGQTYPLEWIIVDADSGHKTRNYLKSIKSKKHKLIWLSESDNGLYDGMNKGFKLANGELVLFLNAADTLISDDIVEKILKSYDLEAWRWAVAMATRVTNDGIPHGVWEYLNHSIGGLALGTRTFCHQACFYEREFLNGLMPYDVDNLASDHLINLRAYANTVPFTLPYVTTLFTDGGVSSRRPLGAAFMDLHKIRSQEDLLVCNSRFLDIVITKLLVLVVKIGGLSWKCLRFVGHRLIKPSKRVYP